LSGPAFGYVNSQRKADGMLKKYGMTAVLRRTGMLDRQCTVYEDRFTPMERIGKMINPVDRKMVMSPLAPNGKPLSPAPDQEEDWLVTFVPGTATENEILRIIEPPERLAPGGVVLYWTLAVRA
jgi:hypothetical protein